MRISDWSSDVCSSDLSGKLFERLSYNDKNPLAGSSDATTGFHSSAVGFDPSVSEGSDLPTLNLGRVFVLAGPGTCSASEAVVNGLRGVDVDVVLVGDTTCGKPYGFYPEDNRSEEHKSELQSLMRISFAASCLKKQKN